MKHNMLLRFLVSKKYSKDIMYSIITILTSAVMSGIFGAAVQFTVTGFLYFAAGLYINRQERFYKGLLIYYLPVLLLIVTPAIIDSLYRIYPVAAIALLGFTFGAFLRKKKAYKTPAMIIYFLLMMFSYPAMENYLVYVYNLNEDKSIKNELNSINFETADNKNLPLKELNGKITVLYLWSTRCSVCYKKLPQVEKLYQKYPRNQVNIYAVNCLYEQENTETVKKQMNKFDYSFPLLFVKAEQRPLLSEMGINGWPHLIILNKDGSVLYNGFFNNDPLVYVDNAAMMINKALASF